MAKRNDVFRVTRKTWIKVKVGLLKAEHQSKIGSAIWLYLYLIDNANWEDGVVYGYTDEVASEALGIPKNTILKQRRSLEAAGYITASKSVHHQTVVIHEWIDPRKYSNDLLNPPNIGTISGQTDQQSDHQTDHQSDHKRSLSLMNDSHTHTTYTEKRDAADAADAQKQRVKTILEAQGRDPARLGYLDEYADTRLNQDRVDVSQFPEPYRITIERFCRLWRVPVPEKVGGKSGAFGDWINGARDLMSAYAEYGPELLDLVYWGGDWIKDSGEPFTVARPAAVLKWTQARAAEMRRKNIKSTSLGNMIEFAMQRFMKRANDDILQSAPAYNERAAKRRQAEQDARARTTKE